MKAERYIVNVCDSVLDYSHGFYRAIVEYYFKDQNLTINKEACFIGARGAEAKKELSEIDIDIDAEYISRLKQSVIDKEECMNKLGSILNFVVNDDIQEKIREEMREEMKSIWENNITRVTLGDDQYE